MDVLHFLKTSHDEIRASLAALCAPSAKPRKAVGPGLTGLVRHLETHLTLQKDYLYPELNDLFAGSEVLIATATAHATVVSKSLKSLVKLSSAGDIAAVYARLTELQGAVTKHFDYEEQALMPKIRGAIRTEDREDLGQVFAEAQSDLLAAANEAPQAAAAPAGSRSRKRA